MSKSKREKIKRRILESINDKATLLVVGGGLGAEKINQTIRKLIPQVLTEFNIIHLCGQGKVDAQFEHITGYTEKEMLAKNNRVFLHRVEKEQFDKIWEDILKDKPYSGVIRRTKPTGEEVWIMSTFTPVIDENGNIFKVIFLGQDITERKLKYQLLEEANREIDRLRNQKNEQK